LKQKHEDVDTLIQDKEFQEWVTASPTRTKLLTQAHKDLDVDAADELFSTFKELRKARGATKAAAADAGNEIVEAQKKAAGAPSGTTGNGESSKGKPIFSRRKIMELMIHNPEEYAARNDEFLAAYAEGRVRA
jgi:type II secretory pathway component GspD/PulD (secretin)